MKIGAEYEAITVYPENYKALKYYGKRGIEEILKYISTQNSFRHETNEGHLLALHGENRKVSLEPGGQLEHAGTQHRNIHHLNAEIDNHYKNLIAIAEEMNVKVINLGIQPLSDLDDIELIPKPRYRIMYPYMVRVGKLGHRMMKQTSSIQISIDYSSEQDSMKKFRTAMGLVPVFAAIFANSPVLNAKLTGYKSYRGHVWTDTDSDRCGILPFAFDKGVSYRSYVDYSLNAGMYFVHREGKLIDMTGINFRQYIEKGHNSQTATYDDWTLHITTLFPEVRFKKYIEIRCFDSQPPENMPAAPALVKGIFYDSDCLEAAWNLVKDWSWEESLQAYNSAHKYALQAKIRGISLHELAKELIKISKIGLNNHNDINDKGENETVYLNSIEEDVKNGICPADKIISKWEKEWHGDMKQLIEYCSYKL